MSSLLLFACGENDSQMNGDGKRDDAGSNEYDAEGKSPVGTPCLTHADCEGLLCIRSEVGYICSSECDSNEDCVPGWTCDPRITEPGNVCICRGDGREVCDGLDNNCDGQVDEGSGPELGCGYDAVCTDGACVWPCSADRQCGEQGRCVDLESDAQHCGACDHRCSKGEICQEGACVKGGHCRDGAEAWTLKAFLIESGHDLPYGFNLDDHVTTAGDPATPSTGCGIVDGNALGIDNSAAELFRFNGVWGEGFDINEIMNGVVAGGALQITAYIRGYEPGGANDNLELSLIINNLEFPQLVDIPATLEHGKIVAELDRLPLPLSGIEVNIGDEPAELNFIVTIRHARLEINEPGTSVSSVAILGGGVQLTGAGGFQADLEQLIKELGLNDAFDQHGGFESVMAMFADLSSNSTYCDTMSLGARLSFEYNESLCN